MKNLSFSLILLLSGCASVPNFYGCRQRTVNSGFCTWSLKGDDFIIDDTHLYNGKTWIDMKIESVYLPAESYSQIKEYILKSCKQNNNCNQNISNWDTKLNSITP